VKWETENTLALIKKAQSNDKNALEILVKENAPLVKSIIKHYLNRGGDYDDLFQVGNLGLIKAILGFCPDFNVRFSTYAVPMIIEGGENNVIGLATSKSAVAYGIFRCFLFS
jgi:RNA polymerase sporulation-specific sigma factor